MTKIVMILLLIATIQYSFMPPIIDLTEFHVFHSDWPPHARFHMVWLLVVGTPLATCVLLALWVKPNKQRTKHASILRCIVLDGFFVSAFTLTSYDGLIPHHFSGHRSSAFRH